MWSNVHDINVMDWTPFSLYLNPMENMWGQLVQKVYENGYQCFSTKNFRTEIQQAWYELLLEVMQNLILFDGKPCI